MSSGRSFPVGLYGRTLTVLHGAYTAKQVTFPSPSRQEKNAPAIVREASSPMLLFRGLIAFPGSCKEASQNWALAGGED